MNSLESNQLTNFIEGIILREDLFTSVTSYAIAVFGDNSPMQFYYPMTELKRLNNWYEELKAQGRLDRLKFK